MCWEDDMNYLKQEGKPETTGDQWMPLGRRRVPHMGWESTEYWDQKEPEKSSSQAVLRVGSPDQQYNRGPVSLMAKR